MTCDGKVALVTGAADGLGKAIANALLSQGAKVLMCDVNVEKGEETLASFQKEYSFDRVLFRKCDITKEEELEATFQLARDAFGGLDIVANNAGIMDEINWKKTIDVNLVAMIRSTELAVDAMRVDKGGNGGIIINSASIAGLLPVYNLPVYVATKHAVVGFTRSMAGLMSEPQKYDVTITPNGGQWGKVKSMHYVTLWPERIGEAFLRLLEEPNPNGAVVLVSETTGCSIMYPDVTETVTLA